MRSPPAAGFTLIELLVVIAIIGMLASVVLASLSGVRVKGRDARRVEDLHNIATALELYWNNNRHYPTGSAGSDRSCWVNQQTSDLSCNPLGALILDNDMPRVPYDPGINTYTGTGGCGGAQFYSYQSTSGGQGYELAAVQESKGSSGCESELWWGSNEYQYYIRTGVVS